MALLPVDEARARILGVINPLDPEEVQIDEALGRSLTTDLAVRRTLPPWDNSAMDGYAVRASDLHALPVTLRVIEKIFAGDAPTQTVIAGTCARIMTGAPMPPGADAVVMQEKTKATDGQVEILEAVKPGANVRKRGEDVREGETLFAAGRELSIADAGALWGQGLERVPVRRRPRVSIVSSGDELCDVSAVEEGKIVDSNSPVLAALVRKAGGIPTRIGRAADTLESLTEHFRRGLENTDVLLTVAGASVGEKDFTREALGNLGVDIDFWKVAMKPGKPLAFGRRGATLIFGLPGNPVSAMVTFELFVRPALRALQGLPPLPIALPARAAVEVPKQPGLRLFVRATMELREGTLWARPLSSQSSGALSSAAGATCLIDLPQDAGVVKSGSEISIFPVSWGA